MKVSLYEQLMKAGASRRDVLKGAASAAALAAASSGTLGALTRQASAQDDLRAQILKIPGVGRASRPMPTAEGRHFLPRPTKATSRKASLRGSNYLHGPQQPECAQPLFRGLLKPWESIRAPRSPGSISRRPTTTPGCSRRSRPGLWTSTSSRWERPSRATPPARACSTRCRTG